MYSQGYALGFMSFFILITCNNNSNFILAEGKRICNDFIEYVFQKYQIKERITKVWKPSINGSTKGFIDGLILNNCEIDEKSSDLILKNLLIELKLQ